MDIKKGQFWKSRKTVWGWGYVKEINSQRVILDRRNDRMDDIVIPIDQFKTEWELDHECKHEVLSFEDAGFSIICKICRDAWIAIKATTAKLEHDFSRKGEGERRL